MKSFNVLKTLCLTALVLAMANTSATAITATVGASGAHSSSSDAAMPGTVGVSAGDMIVMVASLTFGTADTPLTFTIEGSSTGAAGPVTVDSAYGGSGGWSDINTWVAYAEVTVGGTIDFTVTLGTPTTSFWTVYVVSGGQLSALKTSHSNATIPSGEPGGVFTHLYEWDGSSQSEVMVIEAAATQRAAVNLTPVNLTLDKFGGAEGALNKTASHGTFTNATSLTTEYQASSNGKFIASGVAIISTGSVEPPEWAGYPKRPDGYVDTTPFLGWIWVSDTSDWVWSVNLSKFIYLPEYIVSESGSWMYIPAN